MSAKGYYRGAKRLIIDGVPCRVSRIPRNLGFTKAILSTPFCEKSTHDYAEALGIPFGEAEVRVIEQMAVEADKPRFTPLIVKAAETQGYYAGGIRITMGGVPCKVNPTYAAIKTRPWCAKWPR